MRRLISFIGIFLSLSVAHAQTVSIDGKGKNWVHEATGVVLPMMVAEQSRGDISDFSGGQQVDVMIQYAVNDLQTTVYVFHAAMPSAPLWFDVARKTMFIKTNVGTVEQTEAQPRTFVLPGSAVSAGLVQSFAVSGKAASTALATVGLGEWIVTFRMSSSIASPSELEAKLREFIQQTGWPKKLPPMAEAVALNDCQKAAAFDPSPTAETFSGAVALVAAAEPGVEADDGQKRLKAGNPLEFPQLCRHPQTASGGFFIYRFAENDNGYVIPIGDSGRLIVVAPDIVGALVSEDKKPLYRVVYRTHVNHVVFKAFNSLPTPNLTLETVQKGEWLAESEVLGKSRSIRINGAMLETASPPKTP